MPNSHQSYTSVAKLLHWLMALIILVSAVIGLYGALFLSYGITPAETAWKARVITLHKDLATTVLFLIVARVLWRISHRPPALAGMSPFMAKAAHFGHLLLYVLMVLAPLSGWANSSASGHPIPVMGLFEIPRLMAKNDALAPTISMAHAWITYSLLAVIAGHILFALKHQWLDKDGTLQAMMPGRARKSL